MTPASRATTRDPGTAAAAPTRCAPSGCPPLPLWSSTAARRPGSPLGGPIRRLDVAEEVVTRWEHHNGFQERRGIHREDALTWPNPVSNLTAEPPGPPMAHNDDNTPHHRSDSNQNACYWRGTIGCRGGAGRRQKRRPGGEQDYAVRGGVR